MEYINIHVSVIDSAEFKSAEPVDQATWLKLLRYCCGQENGGVIEKAGDLSDRAWQGLVCATRGEVLRETGLWKWEGQDLVVNFYPEESESQVKAMRRGGKIGNRRMQENRKGRKPCVKPPSQAPLSAPLQAGRSRNEMEWKETEGKEMELAAVVPPGTVPSELEVLEAAQKYPGDMARGIPPVIPEGWALSWYAWRMTPAAGAFPEDWNADLTRRFKAAWVNGDPRTGRVKGIEKNCGAVSPNVAAIQSGQRQRELLAELRELEQEIEALVQAGAAVPPEKTARERELRQEISE
jgi:hypothetical protein